MEVREFIDPKAGIPVYSRGLGHRQLDAVLRNYKTRDVIDGKAIYVYGSFGRQKNAMCIKEKQFHFPGKQGLESYKI